MRRMVWVSTTATTTISANTLFSKGLWKIWQEIQEGLGSTQGEDTHRGGPRQLLDI